MRIKRFTLGQLQTNCYFLINEKNETLIIDPADSGDFLTEQILKDKLTPKAILLTHGHFDHILACTELQLNFNLKVFCHIEDKFLINKANDSIKFFLGDKTAFIKPKITYFKQQPKINSSFKFETIHTPGHTPGSCSYYFKNEKMIFSGDVVFNNAVGRWDFDYSNKKILYQSLQILNQMNKHIIIYPGHGEPTTTKHITYLLSAFFSEFR
ncbi:MAG: MBL fold hydrolase [Patescibacteria group bacterium]|nr:MAG: MBL fold hydrolase [Patescibacteria group bacterium]